MKKSQLKQLIREVITEVMESNNDMNKNDSHQPEENRFEWENDPYHSRQFEKSDLSWREYDEEMNPQSYRFKEGEEEKYNSYDNGPMGAQYRADHGLDQYNRGRFQISKPRIKLNPDGPKIDGITFFEVPAGKESIARQHGLTQTNSGKWGIRHKRGRDATRAVMAAEEIFGKGRYWEPKK